MLHGLEAEQRGVRRSSDGDAGQGLYKDWDNKACALSRASVAA